MPIALALAPDDVAVAVVRAAVPPILTRFQRELRLTLKVTFHQWADGETRPVAETVATVAAPSTAAEGRMLFRPNYGGDLFNFHIQIRIPGTQGPGMGC